jgi:hypothetical protein
MKNMWPITILIVLALNNLGADTLANDLPAVIAQIEGEKPDKYLTEIKDIPIPVQNALGQAMRSKEFKMADRGTPWNKTDVVTNPSLPFRRLIWAIEIKQYFVVHYELGGYGYSTHYMVAARDKEKQKWSVLWSAAGFEISRNFPAFIADLKKGKLDSDPKISH